MIPRAKAKDRELRVKRAARRAGGANATHGWAARQAGGEGQTKPSKHNVKKSKQRHAQNVAKRKAMKAAQGSTSRYARKKKYLVKNGGWGFQYPEKPWRSQ